MPASGEFSGPNLVKDSCRLPCLHLQLLVGTRCFAQIIPPTINQMNALGCYAVFNSKSIKSCVFCDFSFSQNYSVRVAIWMKKLLQFQWAWRRLSIVGWLLCQLQSQQRGFRKERALGLCFSSLFFIFIFLFFLSFSWQILTESLICARNYIKRSYSILHSQDFEKSMKLEIWKCLVYIIYSKFFLMAPKALIFGVPSYTSDLIFYDFPFATFSIFKTPWPPFWCLNMPNLCNFHSLFLEHTSPRSDTSWHLRLSPKVPFSERPDLSAPHLPTTTLSYTTCFVSSFLYHCWNHPICGLLNCVSYWNVGIWGTRTLALCSLPWLQCLKWGVGPGRPPWSSAEWVSFLKNPWATLLTLPCCMKKYIENLHMWAFLRWRLVWAL